MFNYQKLQFDGHADFGDEIVITKNADQLADHTLLLCFDLIFPFGFNLSLLMQQKVAAPGNSLHELVCEAIVALRSHRAIVKLFV